MSSNPPDPTQYEHGDREVAEARNLVMEWLGNTFTIEPQGNVLANRSPLALGIFVTACLHGLREDSFTEVEIATARGEVARDREARQILDAVLDLDAGDQADTDRDRAELLLEGVPERDRRARMMVHTTKDTTTLPYRQLTQDAIAYRDLKNIDWEKLAADKCDEPPAWKSFTEEHDTRGCFTCLAGTCMVGYEDVLGDDEEDGEEEPDREAVEREGAHELGLNGD